jgi:hypothetical protein
VLWYFADRIPDGFFTPVPNQTAFTEIRFHFQISPNKVNTGQETFRHHRWYNLFPLFSFSVTWWRLGASISIPYFGDLPRPLSIQFPGDCPSVSPLSIDVLGGQSPDFLVHSSILLVLYLRLRSILEEVTVLLICLRGASVHDWHNRNLPTLTREHEAMAIAQLVWIHAICQLSF